MVIITPINPSIPTAEHECDLISQKLQNPKKLLKKQNLRVAQLEEVKSVLLSGIKDESLKEDFLKLYFSKRKQSGGSDVTKVSLTGRGEAIVTFKDPNSMLYITYASLQYLYSI